MPATRYTLPMPAEPAILVLNSAADEHKALAELAVLSKGPFSAAVFARLIYQAALILLFLPFYLGWRTLGLFLIGAGLVVSGKLSTEPTQFWRRARAVGIAAGLPLTLIGSAIRLGGFENQSIWLYFGNLLHDISSLLLAVGIAGAVWIWTSSGLRSKLLRSFSAVGRTALTNYIGQSAVMSVLATAYGFGLYGGLSRLQLIAVAASCFSLQMVASAWWLRHFRIGPLEWIWRCFTYWRLVPLLAETKAAPFGTITTGRRS